MAIDPVAATVELVADVVVQLTADLHAARAELAALRGETAPAPSREGWEWVWLPESATWELRDEDWSPWAWVGVTPHDSPGVYRFRTVGRDDYLNPETGSVLEAMAAAEVAGFAAFDEHRAGLEAA